MFRYIVHAEFYWDEKLPRMEDSLKKAILKHGIPPQFYCDYTEKKLCQTVLSCPCKWPRDMVFSA